MCCEKASYDRRTSTFAFYRSPTCFFCSQGIPLIFPITCLYLRICRFSASRQVVDFMSCLNVSVTVGQAARIPGWRYSRRRCRCSSNPEKDFSNSQPGLWTFFFLFFHISKIEKHVLLLHWGWLLRVKSYSCESFISMINSDYLIDKPFLSD